MQAAKQAAARAHLCPMPTTEAQFNRLAEALFSLFSAKLADYGPSWRLLRPMAVTDQLYIKASRIRTIQEKGSQQVADSIEEEFMGIANYCLIGLIQLDAPYEAGETFDVHQAEAAYQARLAEARALMLRKNHDYGEAWRHMRIQGITDLILVKLRRIRQIEEANGQTLVSEGVRANLLDMFNYAIFALIKLNEAQAE